MMEVKPLSTLAYKKSSRRGEATIGRHHDDAPPSSHTSFKNPLYERSGHHICNDVPGTYGDSSICSSNTSSLRGGGTQGNGNGAPPRHGDCRFTEMSEMAVLQDPKRMRSSILDSAVVRNGSKNRAPVRVRQRRDGSARDQGGSSNLGIVDEGGRASSGIIIEGKEPPVRSRGCLTTAVFLKLVMVLAALCTGGFLWLQYDSTTGRLCPHGPKKACLDEPVPEALMTVAKLCAGALFPSIAVCVLSKCYATRHFLNNSWLALVVDVEPTHKLHTYYGIVILICSVVHSAAHVARLAYESNLEALIGNAINRSGVAALLLLLPTALPMIVGYLKLKLTFELRKLMHLAFIPFIIAVCFHGSSLRLLGVILLTWYLADRFYFTTRMTFFIGEPNFKIVGRGTLVRFVLPEGYNFKPGAYIQVNCPAISAVEWHPFSLFPLPGPGPRAGFHVEAVGDWTEELFRLSLEKPYMPLWITAAQPSVLEQTAYYDNVILVCTGAGITPAVCVIERFAKKKNVHLLWLSREAGMVAMFEKQMRRVRTTVHLTGSPSAKTKRRIIDLLAPERSEVVACTTSCSSSRQRPTAPPSSSDPVALEAGRRLVASLRNYPGVLKDEDADVDGNLGHFSGEDDSEEDISERSAGRRRRGAGRSSRFDEGGGGGAGVEVCVDRNDDDDELSSAVQSSEQRLRDDLRGHRSRSHSRSQGEIKDQNSGSRGDRRGRSRSRSRSGSRSRSRSRSKSSSGNRSRSGKESNGKRLRGLFPVSLCFGRPNIERFITDTVEGTAVTAEWADTEMDSVTRECSPPPSRLRQALVRLTTNQRISKKDLMSADLSVVKPKSTKLSSTSGYSELGSSASLARNSNEGPSHDSSTWLVLYCGANVRVEKSVANACGELKVAWRKEYFSAW